MLLEQQTGAFRRRWIHLPEWLRVLVVAGAGIVLGIGVTRLLSFIMPLYAAVANETVCPVARVWSSARDSERFSRLRSAALSKARVLEYEPRLDIERIATSEREFWVKRFGQGMTGKELIAFILAEHSWKAEKDPRNTIRPGDVVIDCGGHVGVFTHRALKLGAGKVVTVEPEPTNVECLRRNFQPEIAAGRVVVIPKGVWSFEGNLTMSVSTDNSGMNSLGFDEGGQHIGIPVATIDALVDDLRLERVDYIKMDIEGAEREALAGAQRTLSKFRPRLMLDMYHRPDDLQVLPALIRKAYAGYTMTCGPCETKRGKLVPHVAYFE